ncbi:hypothetical protein [Adhaeribacter pallidiroseus]|uniref:Uncharacterized protein n=1 Tax=Adhaeribacter pallidiroseus TaxID=2072847 RepID=A0A369QJ36_9BACT|nr:hypothetical protein [Adhaeribacter pallidiroseus]RDC63267.1 hypothetical protein AHMF7616_01869 [Adhaeribacter pallidiroseus]
MTKQELDKLVEGKLEGWSFMVLSLLKQSMKNKRVTLSKETYNSLVAQVQSRSGDVAAKMLLSFHDSGRMRDMNTLRFKKRPPIEALEEFVRNVGIGKFNYSPGYDRGTIPISQAKAINRIAWGIAVSMQNNYQHTPGKWFNKTFFSSINKLCDEIATAYVAESGKHIAANFKK